jgi:site-specific recombinase XerD
MSQLKARFVRDLKIRNYSPSTIKSYVSSIILLAKHFKKCPSKISSEELKDYLDILVSTGKSWATINQFISAVNRLHVDTLNNPYPMERIKRPRKQSKVPSILSVDEVKTIIDSIVNLKHKTIVMTIYSGGLRISELCHLRLSDIDSSRMRIIIRNAKGHKDREVILSAKLLVILRKYFIGYHPKTYLFNGMQHGSQYSNSSIRKILKRALTKCGIHKKVCVHTLRHSYATHLMDKGIDLRIIQSLLGHKSIKSTMRYCHLSKVKYAEVKSPLDDLSFI